MDWFLYKNGLRHERVKLNSPKEIYNAKKRLFNIENINYGDTSPSLCLLSFVLLHIRNMPAMSPKTFHCVKSLRIPSFSGLYFPAFRLKSERYSVALHIQSECGKNLLHSACHEKDLME